MHKPSLFLIPLAAICAGFLIQAHQAQALDPNKASVEMGHYSVNAQMAPKLPAIVTLAGAASSVSTNVGSGVCLRISCTVDCAYRITKGASTAIVDDNQLAAKQVEYPCLTSGLDTITFFSATAGKAYPAVQNP